MISSSLQYSSILSHSSICCCVTNQSGTYCKQEGSSLTVLSHISWPLKWSGFLEFWIGQGHKAVNVDICARPRCTSLGIWNGQVSLLSSVEQSYLFGIFRPGQGSNFMDTSGWSFRSLQSGHFIDVKNNEKWQFNYWNYTLNWAIYRCKNDGYTPKNSDFNRKSDETIL